MRQRRRKSRFRRRCWRVPRGVETLIASPIWTLFYVRRVPTDDEVTAVREAVGGENPLRRWEATDYANGEEFQLEGVRTEVSFTLAERVEWLLDQLLVELDDIASPRQKFLAGLAEGLPLYGDELMGPWQARVRAYPQPFRLEMIRCHWNFFPLWYYGEAMSLRDTELWRLDVLLEGVFNLLGVLAAVNRIYFARFELKRTRDFISKMTLAPPHLADRIEALVHLPAQDAAQEFGQLVAETAELVTRSPGRYGRVAVRARRAPATLALPVDRTRG